MADRAPLGREGGGVPSHPRSAVRVHDACHSIGAGCVPSNHARDVLEVMDQVGLDLIPVVRSFESGVPMGLVDRATLHHTIEARGECARVSDAPWIDAPHVAGSTPVWRVLEAPDRALAYIVVDSSGRALGIFRPLFVAIVNGRPDTAGR